MKAFRYYYDEKYPYWWFAAIHGCRKSVCRAFGHKGGPFACRRCYRVLY